MTVRGTRDPSGTVGTAQTVAFENNAEGPIDSINPVTNSLVVLGQTVLVDDTTQFGNTPFSALRVGNIVELSGFEDADGDLRATRVEKTQDTFIPGIEIEATGTIANLDDVNQTFMLNMLIVDFSMDPLIDVPGNELVNGQVVEVISFQNVVNGVLFADSIAVEDIGIQGDPGEAVELQGIITRVTSANTFEVNGQPVRITPDTVFESGSVDNIAKNVQVEVEGVFNADGIVILEEVEFGGGIELEGIITRVTSASTFEVNGQPVRITDNTVFQGGTVNDIAVDVDVEVEGFLDVDGVFVATEVEFLLKGRITDVISVDTFEVNGQLVRITDNTVFQGGTVDDIAVNVDVEVEGFLDANGDFVATEIEFLL